MAAAPIRYPIVKSPSWPVAISLPNRNGPMMPPRPVPNAKKNEIALARISSGKISLTVK